MALLAEVYTGYERLHERTGKHLWSDLEIWEMDGTANYGGAFPAAFARVERQIGIECKHVEWLTAYELFGFMQPGGIRIRLKDPRAARLHSDYESYLRRKGLIGR